MEPIRRKLESLSTAIAEFLIDVLESIFDNRVVYLTVGFIVTWVLVVAALAKYVLS